MNHQDHISTLFSIKGRFSRYSFLAWSFLLALPFIIIAMTTSLIRDDSINATSSFAQLYATTEESGLATILLLFITLVILIPFIVNTIFFIRRLHDINMSGWFSLLIWLPLPFVISLLYFISQFNITIVGMSDSSVLPLIGITLLLNLIFIIFILAKKGTQGINQFGSVRVTLRWEKIVGMIALLFIAASIVGRAGRHPTILVVFVTLFM